MEFCTLIYLSLIVNGLQWLSEMYQYTLTSWWRPQMETFFASLAFVRGIHPSPVSSPHKGQWGGALMVFFFYLPLNKRLSKQSWGWWFEMQWRPLWRHCNVTNTLMRHGRCLCDNARFDIAMISSYLSTHNLHVLAMNSLRYQFEICMGCQIDIDSASLDISEPLMNWSWACAVWDIRRKRILTLNLAKSRLPITYFVIVQSFSNFAQSTTATLSCSVQNFKMIGQRRCTLWADEISGDLSLRGVSGGYRILHSIHYLILS